MEGDLMFSKILVAVGGPDDAEETLSVVSGLAKAFNSEVLVVHMRERVVTSAATIEKETRRGRWRKERKSKSPRTDANRTVLRPGRPCTCPGSYRARKSTPTSTERAWSGSSTAVWPS